jgi:hypothetical protein
MADSILADTRGGVKLKITAKQQDLLFIRRNNNNNYSHSKSTPKVLLNAATSKSLASTATAGVAMRTDGSTQRRVNNKEGAASIRQPAA